MDDEHSAIFQSMNGKDHSRCFQNQAHRIDGPFRGKEKREELAGMRAEDAPEASQLVYMGRKITLCGFSQPCEQALEVLEAGWLFDVDLDNIEVLGASQASCSMVEYKDSAVIAQLGNTSRI